MGNQIAAGGFIVRRELLALGLFAFLVESGAMALDVSEWKAYDIWYSADESVKGEGMFARYNYLGPIGPHFDHRITQEGAVTSVKKTEHGSGTMENEQISRAERANRWITFDWNWYVTSMRSLASIEEDNTMVYSPQSMAVGKGFYARNPVVFSSLLSERTCVKDYATETSLTHTTDRAKAIDKELEASVRDSYFDLDGGTLLESSSNGLNIREDVTDGATHIGVLQGNTADVHHSAWKNPVIDIDQDYLGTYSIDTKMKLNWPTKLVHEADTWLPCCHDGWSDMNYRDQKGFGKSTNGVFDCTCFQAPPPGTVP